MTIDWDSIRSQTNDYYSAKLRKHGATPLGVDWNSESSQQVRFDQLLHIIDGTSESLTLNDFGCGYGALLDHLDSRGLAVEYTGFDLSDDMIACAKNKYRACTRCHFTSSLTHLKRASYTLASGIFNTKLKIRNDEWHAHVIETIKQLADLSTEGFAFNVLSMDSDPEYHRPDLYYADPSFFFDHCRKHYSRSIALLQDYGLYEFTMIVRKNRG